MRKEGKLEIMLILHVSAHIKPDQIEAFKAATSENARASTTSEPGCLRFDVVQQIDDPSRFVLVEIYRTSEDAARHKETPHYERWRTTAEPLLAEPRSRILYTNVIPTDAEFETVE